MRIPLPASKCLHTSWCQTTKRWSNISSLSLFFFIYFVCSKQREIKKGLLLPLSPRQSYYLALLHSSIFVIIYRDSQSTSSRRRRHTYIHMYIHTYYTDTSCYGSIDLNKYTTQKVSSLSSSSSSNFAVRSKCWMEMAKKKKIIMTGCTFPLFGLLELMLWVGKASRHFSPFSFSSDQKQYQQECRRGPIWAHVCIHTYLK